MGDCNSTSNCNPCGPEFNTFNQLAAKAAVYARQANTYAVDAQNAVGAAEGFAEDAEQSFIQFNALYLGAFAVDPTTDNQGNTLQVGAIYWNTVANDLLFWNGIAWVPAADFNQFTLFQTNGTTEQRNLYNRLTDGVSPKDFGAVGDGVTDDTAAIQVWLNHGGNLQGTAGTYVVTSTLTIPNDNIVINGNGMEITHNTASLTSVIRAINRSHITVRNLKINGRKDLKTPTGTHRAYGFDFQNCSNVIVDGCYVQNTIEHGIRFGIPESLAAAISRNIKVVNNTVFDCGNSIIGRGAGIWFYGLVNDFVIGNNIVLECPYAGIFVDDSHSLPNLDILRGNVTGNVITLSTVYGFRNIGIGFSGNRDICFTGNTSIGYNDAFSFTSVQARTQSGFSEISGNYFEGLLVGARLRNLQYVNFSSNTVRTTASVGADDICISAYSDDSFDANSYLKSVKISNNLVYAYRKGIAINEQVGSSLWADDITIDSNRVEYIGPLPPASSVIDGIKIQKTTGNSREGRVNTINNVVSNFYDGIYYDPETPTYCIGNLVTDCVGFGIRTNNPTFALIARNTCRNNGAADYSVSATGNVATTVFKDNEAFSTTPIDEPMVPASTKQNNLNF